MITKHIMCTVCIAVYTVRIIYFIYFFNLSYLNSSVDGTYSGHTCRNQVLNIRYISIMVHLRDR